MKKKIRQKLDLVLWILGLVALALLIYGIINVII